MNPKNESKHPVQNKIYIYAFWLSVTISLIGSGLLYLAGSKVTDIVYQSQLYSLATNIISSILFSIMFSYFSNKEFINLLKEDLNKKTEIISKSVSEEIKKSNLKHIPSHIYRPSKNIDIEFNKNLSNDLSRSSFYFFYGISGKYVPIRIKNTRHRLSFVRIMLCDPLDEYSIRLRATDRKKNPKYYNKSFSLIEEEIKNEIYACIIGLFDIKSICPIEIVYSSATSVIRTEIFDHSVYISMYHTSDGYSKEFPETLRYSSDSIMFDIYSIDFRRQFDICKDIHRFDNKTTEVDLKTHLRKIGMGNLSDENINNLRKEYNEFSQKFVQESMIDKA